MKYMFASDIHGSYYYAKKVVDEFRASGARKLILLGDILYHGPRNDLPREYAPKEVIPLLNDMKEHILAVRGNCEAEVDQMVLEFPVMADYACMYLNDINFYVTHGHLWSPESLPPLARGSAFIFGHIHLPIADRQGDVYILNPGSASLPKGGNPNSYAILDGQHFTVRDFDGNTLKEIHISADI